MDPLAQIRLLSASYWRKHIQCVNIGEGCIHPVKMPDVAALMYLRYRPGR